MFIFKTAQELAAHISSIRLAGSRIGFVPTMGALHQGHLSLIKASKHKTDYTVCSIYVNPTQFNNSADFEKYPLTLEMDISLLAQHGCDVLFLPSTKEMYGEQAIAQPANFGSITERLEGALRPGHFDGVVTIVAKLFNMVLPDEVFFGQKDLQQCMVVKQLVSREFPAIHLNLIPTQREHDGLAMSSRNLRLTAEQRAVAVLLSKAIYKVRDEIKQGTAIQDAVSMGLGLLTHPLLSLEYIECVDSETMMPAEVFDSAKQQAVVVACWCGEVRLIDNVLLMD